MFTSLPVTGGTLRKSRILTGRVDENQRKNLLGISSLSLSVRGKVHTVPAYISVMKLSEDEGSLPTVSAPHFTGAHSVFLLIHISEYTPLTASAICVI